MTSHDLPSEITKGAQLAGNEHGWQISSFPDALANSEALGYACFGGQFQFRLDAGICEMYWLSADSNAREKGETWLAYCARSCSEVKIGFERLVFRERFCKTRFGVAGGKGGHHTRIRPIQRLVFVAYFIDESEWLKDRADGPQASCDRSACKVGLSEISSNAPDGQVKLPKSPFPGRYANHLSEMPTIQTSGLPSVIVE